MTDQLVGRSDLRGNYYADIVRFLHNRHSLDRLHPKTRIGERLHRNLSSAHTAPCCSGRDDREYSPRYWRIELP